MYKDDPAGLRVTSEWEDSYFLERLIVGEPMRTTLRFVVPENGPPPDPRASRVFLDSPIGLFFGRLNPPPEAKIHVTADRSVPLKTFLDSLDELQAKTLEDMFASMGFRRYEMYYGKQPVVGYDLKQIGKGNSKWIGD